MDRTWASEARNAGSIPAGCKTNEMSIASGATELLGVASGILAYRQAGAGMTEKMA